MGFGCTAQDVRDAHDLVDGLLDLLPCGIQFAQGDNDGRGVHHVNSALQAAFFAHCRPCGHREQLVVHAFGEQPTQFLEFGIEHTNRFAGFGQQVDALGQVVQFLRLVFVLSIVRHGDHCPCGGGCHQRARAREEFFQFQRVIALI